MVRSEHDPFVRAEFSDGGVQGPIGEAQHEESEWRDNGRSNSPLTGGRGLNPILCTPKPY